MCVSIICYGNNEIFVMKKVFFLLSRPLLVFGINWAQSVEVKQFLKEFVFREYLVVMTSIFFAI